MAEVLLLALIAWLASKLFLLLITPAETGPGAAGIGAPGVKNTLVENYDVLKRYDPFRAKNIEPTGTSDIYVEAVETTLNISVSGMMLLDGGLGSAIIKSTNGGEQTYLVGDEIENGVSLERLEPGRAIISRNGVLEAVTVDVDKITGSSRPQNTSPTSPSRQASMRPGVSLSRLSQIITLRPVRDKTGSYVVMPGSDAVAFYATGLAEGDVIKKVNNRRAPSSPETLFEMFNNMPSAQKIVLTVERGGKEIAVTIEVSELR